MHYRYLVFYCTLPSEQVVIRALDGPRPPAHTKNTKTASGCVCIRLLLAARLKFCTWCVFSTGLWMCVCPAATSLTSQRVCLSR